VQTAVAGPRRPQHRIQPRRIAVPPDEQTTWAGIRIQTQAAALVDALAELPKPVADSLLAWTVTRKLVSAAEFAELVGRRRGRRGLARVAVYLAMFRAGAASRAEVIFHILMSQHGITGWEPNATIFVPGYGMLSVDVLFRKARLAVEIDGWLAHNSRGAFQTDRSRQNALVQDGYKVLRFTWEDLTLRAAYCVDQIKRAQRAVEAA
jgi:hypothetical protein